MRDWPPEALRRASLVQVVLLDVDGVLTDGRLHMSSSGEESRSFHVRDGLGIRLAQRSGLGIGIISGRDSKVVADRAAELQISEVHQGVLDKIGCYEEIRDRLGLGDDAFCFVGDDLLDVRLMRRVGFAAAPRDAAAEAREAAEYVASFKGGRGAVREIIDLILVATGKWDPVTEPFLK
jgi:3-deoxy-D-manno-octulosonate 8-phosphate phosphatase (KDO 8-P phosphatase)